LTSQNASHNWLMIFLLPENSRSLTPNDDHRCHGPAGRHW